MAFWHINSIRKKDRCIGGFRCTFLLNMDIKIRQEYLSRAMELHRSCPVVDAHLDLAGEILLRKKNGERNIIKNHYLNHFKAANVKLVFSSIYVENRVLNQSREREPAAGWANALEQIDVLKQDIEELENVIPVYNREDLERVLSEEKIGILIYMEGLDCIGEDISRLDQLYAMGVRGCALTWSRPNALATGCCKATESRQIKGGLTEAGVAAVRRMEELSMFLDVSHLNDDGFAHICRITDRPFLATHSGSRTVYENYRNLTDWQLQELAGRGGIIGVNGCKYIAGSLSGNHLEMLCRHVEYQVKKIGAGCVGYGFDLCDSYDRARAALQGRTLNERDDCLLNHSQVPLLTAALLQRGMEEEDVQKIIGGNFVAYLRKAVII